MLLLVTQYHELSVQMEFLLGRMMIYICSILERKAEYKALSVSVRSQIKRAVKLYSDYRTQTYNF